MRLRGGVAVLAACVLAACVPLQPKLTPLEIQAMQTREFEASKKVVFAGVISVFQDLGYTVDSADRDTGLITAKSAAESRSSTFETILAFVSLLDTVASAASDSHSSDSPYVPSNYITQTHATAFIERIGKITKLRLNFVERVQISSGSGQSRRKDTPILKARIYQNAFERIENAIFIRSGN